MGPALLENSFAHLMNANSIQNLNSEGSKSSLNTVEFPDSIVCHEQEVDKHSSNELTVFAIWHAKLPGRGTEMI